jgi:hypothetical protein
MESFSTPEEGAERRGEKELQGMSLPVPLKQKEQLTSIRKGRGFKVAKSACGGLEEEGEAKGRCKQHGGWWTTSSSCGPTAS